MRSLEIQIGCSVHAQGAAQTTQIGLSDSAPSSTDRVPNSGTRDSPRGPSLGLWEPGNPTASWAAFSQGVASAGVQKASSRPGGRTASEGSRVLQRSAEAGTPPGLTHAFAWLLPLLWFIFLLLLSCVLSFPLNESLAHTFPPPGLLLGHPT